MSNKKYDNNNRWRNKTISFRMSEEENKLLDSYVRMSGLQKQEYLIQRALNKPILVKGTPKVYTALKNEARLILEMLEKIDENPEILPDLLNTINFFGNIINEFKNIDKENN